MLVVVIAVGCVTVAVVNIVHVVVMQDSLMAAVLTVDVVGMCMGLVIISHLVKICAFVHLCISAMVQWCVVSRAVNGTDLGNSPFGSRAYSIARLLARSHGGRSVSASRSVRASSIFEYSADLFKPVFLQSVSI